MLHEIVESRNATPVSATPSLSPTTPGPTTSKSHHSTVSITADSIQPIPPFRPRKSKEWVAVEVIFFIIKDID